jgi:hypothetical protein
MFITRVFILLVHSSRLVFIGYVHIYLSLRSPHTGTSSSIYLIGLLVGNRASLISAIISASTTPTTHSLVVLISKPVVLGILLRCLLLQSF